MKGRIKGIKNNEKKKISAKRIKGAVAIASMAALLIATAGFFNISKANEGDASVQTAIAERDSIFEAMGLGFGAGNDENVNNADITQSGDTGENTGDQGTGESSGTDLNGEQTGTEGATDAGNTDNSSDAENVSDTGNTENSGDAGNTADTGNTENSGDAGNTDNSGNTAGNTDAGVTPQTGGQTPDTTGAATNDIDAGSTTDTDTDDETDPADADGTADEDIDGQHRGNVPGTGLSDADTDDIDTEDLDDEEEEDEEEEEEEEEESPSFYETVTVAGANGNVRITVSADAGVLPAGSSVRARAVSASEQAAVEGRIDSVRDEDANVVASYTYDISILDENGNEIEPDNSKGRVSVSFTLAEAGDKNLDASVYHTSGSSVEKLDNVSSYSTTLVAQTDGFSYYTVEFTYGNLEYVMEGDTEVALRDILFDLGLRYGTVTDVQVSSPELFSASNETGEWIITAHQAFSTEESMTVTIDGVEYVITVTDTWNPLDFDAFKSQIMSANSSDRLIQLANGNITFTENYILPLGCYNDITIHLDDHSLILGAYTFEIGQGKTIHITDPDPYTNGNISASTGKILVNGGTLMLEGGTVGCTIEVINGGKVYLSGGAVSGSQQYGIHLNSEDSECHISNSATLSGNKFGIYVGRGSIYLRGNPTISGGTGGAGIYLPSACTISIDGAVGAGASIDVKKEGSSSGLTQITSGFVTNNNTYTEGDNITQFTSPGYGVFCHENEVYLGQSYNTTVSVNGWTYGSSNPPSPSVSANPGNAGSVVYKYFTDNNGTLTTTACGASESGGRPTKAGTYYVRASIPAAGNYAPVMSDYAQFTISPKTVTVSGITASDKEYDGNTNATVNTTNADITGKVAGDSVTVSVTATGTFGDKNAGNNKTVNLVLSNITLSGTDAANYQVSNTGNQTTTASITKKHLTSITGITANEKEYDGTTTATLDSSNAQFAGMVDGDNLTVTVTGTFDDANVGNGKRITINNLVILGGTDKDNYVDTISANMITAPTGNITPKSISGCKVVITHESYVFNGNERTVTYKVEDPARNNAVLASTDYTQDASSHTRGTDIGTYTIKVNGTGNYTGSVEGTWTIGSGITPVNQTITYNGSTYNVANLFTIDNAVSTVSYSLESGGTGDGTLKGSTLTITKAGTIKIKATGTVNNGTANSRSISETATLTVRKGAGVATLSIADVAYGKTITPKAESKTNKSTYTIVYQLEGSTSTSTSTPSAVGKYTATVTYPATDLYEKAVASTTFSIIQQETTKPAQVPPVPKDVTPTVPKKEAASSFPEPKKNDVPKAAPIPEETEEPAPAAEPVAQAEVVSDEEIPEGPAEETYTADNGPMRVHTGAYDRDAYEGDPSEVTGVTKAVKNIVPIVAGTWLAASVGFLGFMGVKGIISVTGAAKAASSAGAAAAGEAKTAGTAGAAKTTGSAGSAANAGSKTGTGRRRKRR